MSSPVPNLPLAATETILFGDTQNMGWGVWGPQVLVWGLVSSPDLLPVSLSVCSPHTVDICTSCVSYSVWGVEPAGPHGWGQRDGHTDTCPLLGCWLTCF